MDSIIITNLEIYAYHGVHVYEKENGQRFYVSATINVDLKAAGATDNLDKTVNYSSVCKEIQEVMLENKFDLIEAAAENIANTILIKHNQVHSVEITVSKPDAPIHMEFENIGVHIIRGRHKVYLGLGSNLGDKEGYLDYAIEQLGKDELICVKKISSYIVTEPYGDVEQDDFMNGCVEIETLYSPYELLDVIHDIENGAGRKRVIHWGPRTLDIDILMYDDEIVIDDNLMIPHVEMAKRDFVLRPLVEIAPYEYHPLYKMTMKELYEKLEAQ